MSLPKIGYPISSITVPSTGKNIKIRPFTVKEEKVLLLASEDGNESEIKDAVIDLLQNCITSRGVKVENLASFDLEYIYLKIRSASVGSTVEFVVTCKDDGETTTTVTVNLEDVEVEFPEGHDKKIMLDDKIGCVMKYPGIDTFVNVSLLKKFEEDEVIDFIADSIDQIFNDDEVFDSSTTTKEEFKEFVENMTRDQFDKFSEFFATAPKLSHTFKAENPKTGVVSEYIIEGLSNFFG
tara:strand:- start:2337 stop:3050 length:714 start_codon:yes stop_codon:yes gene_type:complete